MPLPTLTIVKRLGGLPDDTAAEGVAESKS